MPSIFKNAVRAAAIALVGAIAALPVSAPVQAQGVSQERQAQMAQSRAMQAQAAKMRMMQARQAQAAQAGMATAMVTAATLAATDAGECSPYLAKWMMTKSIAAKMAYEACMED